MTCQDFTRRLLAVALLLAGTVGSLSAQAAENDSSASAEVAEQAQRLVGQLGSRSFLKRKQAMNDLVRIGLPALKALEAGALSPNREISYRCERVLLVVRDLDLQRKLVAFLRDKEPDKYKLPGWKLYGEAVGATPDSKLLFVQMQKADPELMQAVEGPGRELSGLLTERLLKVIRRSSSPKEGELVGKSGAILFAIGDSRVSVNQQLASYVHRMVLNAGLRTVMTGKDGTADVMRKLLSRWLKRQDATDPYVNLLVAMQYELKESLGFGVRILEGGNKSSSARKMALLCVNRFGDAKNVAVVAPFLKDKSVVSTTSSADGMRIRIQVGDLALATLITLRKQDHRKYGFPHIRYDSFGNFRLDSLHFATDEDRQAALAKWQKFQESNELQGPG